MCQPITGRCCTSVCHLLNYLLISNAKFLFLPFRLVTTFPWFWQLSCENYWCLDIRDLSRNSRFTEFGILKMSCCKSAQMTETSFTILSHCAILLIVKLIFQANLSSINHKPFIFNFSWGSLGLTVIWKLTSRTLLNLMFVC